VGRSIALWDGVLYCGTEYCIRGQSIVLWDRVLYCGLEALKYKYILELELDNIYCRENCSTTKCCILQ